MDLYKVEQQRQNELAIIEKKIAALDSKKINALFIENSSPDSIKLKGLAKLPSLLTNIVAQIPLSIQPSLQSLIEKYIPEDKVCPTVENLQSLLLERNNIVQSLNQIGNKINQTGSSITGLANFLTTTLTLLKTIDNATIIASAALKFTPVAPGAATSLLNDSQTFIRKTTFDEQGNSKLSKTQSIINSASLVISMAGSYTLQALNLLKIIDTFIKKCDQYANIVEISSDINEIAESQQLALNTENQITYNGFILEIEEVPFSPTVTRKRAVGKNIEGIPLIFTPLSFTTNNLTLINELKFIIDKDNLKAY
jgi:hypothetical protein